MAALHSVISLSLAIVICPLLAPPHRMNPTRTVIIAGFSTREELEEYRASVFSPDRMAEHYSLPDPNILFLVFYDLRDSVKFSTGFRAGDLSISYTISMHEFPKKNESCSEENLQSTVTFTFKGIDIKIDDSFVMGFLKQYGDIRALKATQAYQKSIEFYDIRSARKAFGALNASPFGTGEISCEWDWDMSARARMEYVKQADEFIRAYTRKEGEPVAKKMKVEGSTCETTKKNMFIALFDRFIVDNIMEIEKIFR